MQQHGKPSYAEHKELEFVSVWRFLRHGGEIMLLVSAGLFIPWANTLLGNHQSAKIGESFFKKGAIALYLMGVAFILLAGLHLIKHLVNRPHRVYKTEHKESETYKNLTPIQRVVRATVFTMGFATLSAAFVCIGVASLAYADGLFIAAGQTSRSSLENMSVDKQIQLFIAGIALFGIYAIFREALTIYKTTANNGKEKFPNELHRYDKNKVYRAVSLIFLLGGIGSLLTTLVLYKGNTSLLDNDANHLMQVFLMVGISALVVHYLMKLPRLYHKHQREYRRDQDQNNYKKMGAKLSAVAGKFRSAILEDPVRDGGYNPQSNEKATTISRVFSYLFDIAAIISGCCVLGYLVPALSNHADTLNAGSKFFTQGSSAFIVMGVMFIGAGILHMIHRSIDEFYRHKSANEIDALDNYSKKAAYGGRNILWHSILGAGFICVGISCLGGNSMSSETHTNLLIAGVTLIFTYAIFKGLKHLLKPEQTIVNPLQAVNQINMVDDNAQMDDDDNEQLQYQTKWFHSCGYQSASFLMLVGSASTFIWAMIRYKGNMDFTSKGINRGMAVLLCIGAALAILHCLMKLPEVLNKHGVTGEDVSTNLNHAKAWVATTLG